VITVLDYGVGNVGSVLNMLKRGGFEARLISDPDEVQRADKLILPGVGAFDHGMDRLQRLGLVPVLHECARRRRIPILGIFLGCQLMARASEEGQSPGLGWIDADVVEFRFEGELARLPRPHMGWNEVAPRGPARLFAGLGERPRFYFVHSFHLRCADPADVAGETLYGYPFTAAIERGNLFGVQFHPEKSHRYGLQVLSAFARLESCSAPA